RRIPNCRVTEIMRLRSDRINETTTMMSGLRARAWQKEPLQSASRSCYSTQSIERNQARSGPFSEYLGVRSGDGSRYIASMDRPVSFRRDLVHLLARTRLPRDWRRKS